MFPYIHVKLDINLKDQIQEIVQVKELGLGQLPFVYLQVSISYYSSIERFHHLS